MNARTALLAVALTATAALAPAYAGSTTVGDLAEYTGLSERKVRMILGDRSAFPEYTVTYNRSLAQFKRALGEERAEQLLAGETVMLELRPDVRVATIDERGTEERTP